MSLRAGYSHRKSFFICYLYRAISRKETTMKKKYIALIIMTLISFALTPRAFRYAAACRYGARAIGGEIFVPFAGLILWLLWQEIAALFCPYEYEVEE